MKISEMLTEIRTDLINQVAHKLSPGEIGQELVAEQLNQFFDLLLQAVASGDPAWIKPILIEWAGARTETELEDMQLSLSAVLDAISEGTLAVSNKSLGAENTIELMEVVLPIFNYCYSEVARQEMIVRVGYFSARLESVLNQLDQLGQSKSDFISVAAHEFKTPLTLIEGYTDMLKEHVGGPGTQGDLLLKGMEGGTARLAEIVNDMIDVSLIDNRLLELNFQPTWINRLLVALNNEMKEGITARNQTLIINDFPGSNVQTFADSERIYQALRNLLSNAIKYTPDGGVITIDGRLLEGFIEVTFADSGIGIDADDQQKIFQKFGLISDPALHSSGKTKFKGGGPGLGLPITKGIMEAHGGTIWVESEGFDEKKFMGSIFHVLLPIRTQAPDVKVARIFEAYANSDNSES